MTSSKTEGMKFLCIFVKYIGDDECRALIDDLLRGINLEICV